MRLKIFLTPLAFLIAVVVSIWYIWPAVMDIQLKMDEVKISQDNLDSTLTKKNNVELLIASLEKNKDKEDFISNFLPASGDEEKIVNGLNYLASDSGVNLLNVSITDDKTASQPAIVAPIVPGIVPGEAGITPPEMPTVKFAVANVSVSGKYENIKIFLGQIYKMEILSKINSLSLSKASGTDGESDILSANAEIKIGYLPYISQAGNNLSSAFSKSSFNFNSYTKINELIARKIPVLDAGQKGKANPFLP